MARAGIYGLSVLTLFSSVPRIRFYFYRNTLEHQFQSKFTNTMQMQDTCGNFSVFVCTTDYAVSGGRVIFLHSGLVFTHPLVNDCENAVQNPVRSEKRPIATLWHVFCFKINVA